MAQFRPAGLSDEDSDSDDCGFYEKPVRTYYPPPQPNLKKKLENNLQDAIVNGNIKEIEKIVICELKNDVNVKLDSGWTPLIHACFHAQEKIVLYLLDKGADPNLHAESLTPLMAACSNSSASGDAIYSIVQNLIARDCILNIGDKYGQTPLMRAIGSGRVKVVKLLVENNANIEMRDNQGWTAVFWAAHNNQPEVLEMLMSHGGRLTELDRSGRTPLDIANSHDNQVIIEMLEKNIKSDEDASDMEKSAYLTPEVRSWHDYYPGINKCEKPNYKGEIAQLLYGMNCESLTTQIVNAGLDLRSFLLLDEADMVRLGVDMPYEKQRLKTGLRNFHTRGWKLNAVAGLYAMKADSYSVLDCLTTLGTHLQQVYVLEATLQYTLREYQKVQNQIKFEPPDSPVLVKMKTAANKILTNVNSIRREVKSMKTALIKISKTNPQPADLIREASVHELVLSYAPEAMLFFALGFLVYRGKTLFNMFLKK